MSDSPNDPEIVIISNPSDLPLAREEIIAVQNAIRSVETIESAELSEREIYDRIRFIHDAPGLWFAGHGTKAGFPLPNGDILTGKTIGGIASTLNTKWILFNSCYGMRVAQEIQASCTAHVIIAVDRSQDQIDLVLDETAWRLARLFSVNYGATRSVFRALTLSNAEEYAHVLIHPSYYDALAKIDRDRNAIRDGEMNDNKTQPNSVRHSDTVALAAYQEIMRKLDDVIRVLQGDQFARTPGLQETVSKMQADLSEFRREFGEKSDRQDSRIESLGRRVSHLEKIQESQTRADRAYSNPFNIAMMVFAVLIVVALVLLFWQLQIG